MEDLHLPHHHGEETQLSALRRELEKTDKFQIIADVFRQLGDADARADFLAAVPLRAVRGQHLGDDGHVEPRRLAPSAGAEGKRAHYLAPGRKRGLLSGGRYRAGTASSPDDRAVMEIACPEEDARHGA